MAALVITPAAVVPSASASYLGGGVGVSTKAYEAVLAGQIAYVRTITSEGYGLATCTGASPLCHPVGMFVNNAAAGQPVNIITSDPALIMNAVLVVGKVYVLGAAPGSMHQNVDEATGWKKSTLGIAISTTQLDFRVSPQESPAMA